MGPRARILSLWLIHRIHKKRKMPAARWKYWIHPINEERDQFGAFATLYDKLREDDGKFFNYFRMTVASFDILLVRVENQIQKQNTQMRNCIPPVMMLAVTLRYLASGCTFTDLHYIFRIGISTASKIVREVCPAIWLALKDEFLPIPTTEQYKNIANDFEEKANFPHCVGAVDGKHIRLFCPKHSGSMYYNYKQYFSIVLMAVADSKFRFIYANIGSYGKDCDSSILKNTPLWKAIENNSHQLPSDEYIPAFESPSKIPYFFLGDEGFGLHRHLLRPYAKTSSLSVAKRIFNYRLSRARRHVECAFGILSNKWRIFHRPLNVKPEFAIKIVKACVILHNYVLERDGFAAEDITTIQGLEDINDDPVVRGNQSANDTRNMLSEYFLSQDGSVPWQMSKI